MTTLELLLPQLQKLNGDQLTLLKEIVEVTSSNRDELHLLGRFLGIEWGNDGSKATMKLGSHNANTYGVAQGGSLFTLADVAIGFHIVKKLPSDKRVFTLEMKINFIKKGKGQHVFAVPRILHWGRSTVVADCEILDEENNIISHSLGTFFIE